MNGMSPLLLIPILTIAIVLSLSISNVNAIAVNNTDFSINVPDNWAYTNSNILGNIFGSESWISAIPNEFSNLLVNSSQEFSAKAVQKGGAYSVFAVDTEYPFRNVPVETYTQYANNLSKVKIFSGENATIDGEEAVRIHRTPKDNTTNVEVVAYYSVHKGKPYWINYVASAKDFQRYLPEFEQMVKSFKFVD